MANSKFSGDVKRTYAVGEVIVREGDVDGEMYIIQKGRVSVRKRVGDDELELAILRKGEIFGEMALLEGEPRTSTVYALEPTSVLVIKSGGFLMRIRRDPTFAFELMQQLSGRVRHLNDQLAHVTATAEAMGIHIPIAPDVKPGRSGKVKATGNAKK